MQEPTPTVEHPLSSIAGNADPSALTHLLIGFVVGVFIGVAIMKVRADRKKKRGEAS